MIAVFRFVSRGEVATRVYNKKGVRPKEAARLLAKVGLLYNDDLSYNS